MFDRLAAPVRRLFSVPAGGPPDSGPPRSVWVWLAPLPMVAWPLYRLLTGAVRWEYLAVLVLAPLLCYAGPRSRKLFAGLYPVALVGVLYEAQGHFKRSLLTAQQVHLCDLRDLEMRFFGIELGGQRATVHDWIQAHTWLPFDLYAAIPYGTYLFVAIATAVWLFRRDEGRQRVFAWCFLLLNLLGFATYRLYPAAPPWYYHAHGCVVDMASLPDPGPNLTRVDAWLGYSYFHGLYSRSTNVFGAVPSLHVAYPLLILLSLWRSSGPLLRSIAAVYAVSMCAAAVYLDHHWIVDIVLGLSYALFSFVSLRLVFDRWLAPSAATSLPPRSLPEALPAAQGLAGPFAGSCPG